jgi:hypothetical protein
MATATSAAAVLPPADREQFLDAVARQLAGHEPGPGAEHRAVVTVFHTVWKPPELPAAKSRWNRERPRFDHASKRDF